MQDIIEEFYAANREASPYFPAVPAFETLHQKYDWLLHRSGVPYWRIELEGFPFEEIYNEALSVKDLFIDHRANDPSQGGANHQGWSSLTVHGISQNHTMNWDSYPEYKQLGNEELVPYKWTEVADRIPKTIKYFKKEFPHKSYMRIRFMLLKAGGYILPHRDREHKLLFPINIALNNPKGCEFVMENQGLVPFEPGQAYLLDLSNRHAVWNRSNEDRIHIIVHWKNELYHLPQGKKWADWVLKSMEEK